MTANPGQSPRNQAGRYSHPPAPPAGLAVCRQRSGRANAGCRRGSRVPPRPRLCARQLQPALGGNTHDDGAADLQQQHRAIEQCLVAWQGNGEVLPALRPHTHAAAADIARCGAPGRAAPPTGAPRCDCRERVRCAAWRFPSVARLFYARPVSATGRGRGYRWAAVSFGIPSIGHSSVPTVGRVIASTISRVASGSAIHFE
jgi:hypothetical protein